MSNFAVMVGDCREVLASMEALSVDAVIADPPYQTGQWQRPESGAGGNPKAVFRREDWDIWDSSWIPDALRISRGPVLVFCPAGRIPELATLAEPWRLLIWAKRDPRPRPGSQTLWAHEPIIALRSNFLRGEWDWRPDSSPRLGRDLDATGHPHQKPIEIIRWLVRLASPVGGLVLDPFMGSGTTGVACVEEGRRFVGIELSEEYAEIARRRIAAAQPGLGLGAA